MNAAQGLATGNGVTIALLSTGADPTVPGLVGKVDQWPGLHLQAADRSRGACSAR